MKNIKTVVKQLALIFVVFLSLYNCQNDDAVILDSKVTPQQSAITKSVSASEIPKVMQFLQSKSNSRLEFLVDDSNTELGVHRSHEENLSMTTALTDHIKMVTNSYGKSNYTFELIEQGDKTGVYFINLVVKEYRDELYMYIVKYVPDATWLQTHHISRDFNVFTGHLYFYSADGTYVGKTTMTNGTATSSFQKHPCEGETGETETTDNSSSSSSSNSGTGGGGAIGSDCYVYLEWYECNGNNSDEEHSSEECGGSSGTGSGWTLVIVCEEGIRSMRDALRHPCDGGSTIGGGTNTSTSSCETITGTTCNDVGETLMEWDDNCNCVESQTIENSGVGIVYFDKDYQMFVDGLDEALQDFLEDNPDIDEAIQNYFEEHGMDDTTEAFVENVVEVMIEIEDNPYFLIEIDCNQIQQWQVLAQHTAPQSVQDKINSLPNSWANDFEIQSIDDANGTVVNLDYFSVNVTSLPNNPTNDEQFTADEFLDYMRRNFNDFVNGSTFEPYCEISSMCQTETDLWNSNNPLGSVIYIDIPGDDGIVICTEYTNSHWYFMTMNAPYAGNHPVSGTRQFGYELNTDGSYSFYVRGVDRFDSNIIENLSYIGSLGDPFFGADDLWESFQNKTTDFVNNNGGSSIIIPPVKNRPDWDEVEQVLNGERPISDLGCN